MNDVSLADRGARPRVVTLGGVFLILLFAVLAWQSHRALSVWLLLGVVLVAWTAFWVAWKAAASMSARQLLPRLLIVAVALRVIGFCGSPVFEDDWYRYLWDGRQLATTGNPYDIAPRAHFTDESVPDAFQSILSHINHPDVPTIYGPLCQLMFAVSYWIAPAQLWSLKLILVATDLLTLWFLLKLATPRHALLYAWCPLVIQEVAFTAHVEILGVCLIVAALWVRKKIGPAAPQNSSFFSWDMLLPVLCAGAVAARIHALLLVPLLLWPLRWRSVAAFAVALALLYAPFWIQGSAADLAGLKAFLGEWEFNSSLFGVVKWLTGWQAAKLVCNTLFLGAAVTLLARFTRSRTVSGSCHTVESIAGHMLVLLGAFFLCSAVVNPWYLLWLAPLAAVRPSLTAFAAMAAVSLSYLHGGTFDAPGLAPYEHPEWLRPLEYLFILAAACFEGRRNLMAANRNAD